MKTEKKMIPESGWDMTSSDIPFNKKYPPNKKLYGQSFEGYPNKALGVLLYDFAVQGYGVELSYNGKTYYFMDAGEGVVTDSHFSERKEVFDSPMALIG